MSDQGIPGHSPPRANNRAWAWWSILFLFAIAAGGTVLVSEEQIRRRQQAQAVDFQTLLGGVGFGPATDLSGCTFSFDPRLDGSCSEDCGAIPGGSCFCPRHAGSVFFYRTLEGKTWLSVQEEGHESLP